MKTFYCPGGLNYEKMNTPSKLAMKCLLAFLNQTRTKLKKTKFKLK
jgi:hypothetical protein